MAKEYDLEKLKELIASKDVDAIVSFMKENELELLDKKIEPIDKNYFKEKIDYWDLEQYLTKICLNSSYGDLLQSSSVFYDFRLGASTTYSGKLVVYFLTSKANELLIGDYQMYGHCAEYNDTDSVYCYIGNDEFKEKHPNFDYSRDNMVKYADGIADQINECFPDYMKKTFHCTQKGAELEKAGREVVASRGIYVSKKRYALMVYDKDGFRQDTHGKPGKLKIMGLQIQRSDTSKPVRLLLKKMLEKLLTDGTEQDLQKIIIDFYNNYWLNIKPWNKGTPKPLNKFDHYVNIVKKGNDGCFGKTITIPSQIKGAINFNKLIDYYDDKKTKKLVNGDKVYLCKLNPNNFLHMDCVAISLELKDKEIPKWFKELPFYEEKTLETAVQKPIDSIFESLNWNLNIKKLTENTVDVSNNGVMFL